MGGSSTSVCRDEVLHWASILVFHFKTDIICNFSQILLYHQAFFCQWLQFSSHASRLTFYAFAMAPVFFLRESRVVATNQASQLHHFRKSGTKCFCGCAS